MAAGATYTPIQTQTLGSAASSVSFNSIPSTYTDLILVFSASAASNDYINFRVNGDTGSNYSGTELDGTGSAAVSSRFSNTTTYYGPQIYTSNYAPIIMQFMNYSNTTTYKTWLARENNPALIVQAKVGLWRSTAAITSMTIYLSSGGNTFTASSQFTLYGIASA